MERRPVERAQADAIRPGSPSASRFSAAEAAGASGASAITGWLCRAALAASGPDRSIVRTVRGASGLETYVGMVIGTGSQRPPSRLGVLGRDLDRRVPRAVRHLRLRSGVIGLLAAEEHRLLVLPPEMIACSAASRLRRIRCTLTRDHDEEHRQQSARDRHDHHGQPADRTHADHCADHSHQTNRTRLRRDRGQPLQSAKISIAARRVCGVDTSNVAISARDLDQEGAPCRAGRCARFGEPIGRVGLELAVRRRGGGRSEEPDRPARRSQSPQRSRRSSPHPRPYGCRDAAWGSAAVCRTVKLEAGVCDRP